jgi:hypothetical protein
MDVDCVGVTQYCLSWVPGHAGISEKVIFTKDVFDNCPWLPVLACAPCDSSLSSPLCCMCTPLTHAHTHARTHMAKTTQSCAAHVAHTVLSAHTALAPMLVAHII